VNESIRSVMKSPRLNAQLQLCVACLLVASLLAVPISVSAKGVFIGLALGFIVVIPAYRNDLLSMFAEPWCKALLIFFLIVLLACAWSPASAHEKITILNKYNKLFCLPILVVGFRDPRARRFGIYAFIAAMTVTCLLSILKAAGLSAYNDPTVSGQVFYNYIVTSLMMTMATYLCALLCTRAQGTIRFLYATLALLFSYQILFINEGRTGYLMYALLMILFVVQTCSLRKAVFAVVLGGSLFSLSCYLSPVMHNTVSKTIGNVRDYRQGNKNTSLGFRMQFHSFAKNMFLNHPWIGNGTGSYTHFFREVDPVPSWQDVNVSPKKIFEPHSQYWLVAAEFGLAGVLSLMFFLGSLFVASLRLHAMRAVAVASIVLFMAGSLSDSLLFYSSTGYFFLIFMGMCLGEHLGRTSSKTEC
jgi:O-antigen ligase